MTTYETVKAIILTHLEIEESAVTPEASLTKDLSADSLDLLDILMDLEETFDASIPEKATGIRVKDLVTYLESNGATASAEEAQDRQSA